MKIIKEYDITANYSEQGLAIGRGTLDIFINKVQGGEAIFEQSPKWEDLGRNKCKGAQVRLNLKEKKCPKQGKNWGLR